MKRLTIKITAFALLLFVLTDVSCDDTYVRYNYQEPEKMEDGLEVATMEQMNIDTPLIIEAVNRIKRKRFGEVHSMLIYKNNKLVVEEYFQGHKYQWDAPKYHGEEVYWNRKMKHSMMSVTKSFMSACIGIAIDKGFIENINQSIFDYLPNHQHLKKDNKEHITIEHLITMSSGLAWDEWSAPHGGEFTNDIDALWFAEDQVSSILQRDWRAVPGTFFTYNGGGMIVLSEILKNASGMNMDEFSKKYLFEPLNIKTAEWTQYPSGIFDTAGSLKITPRDMIKLGITYLNKGIWNGERIISAEWVENSSVPFGNNHSIVIPGEDSGENGYAYTWWTSEFSHKGKIINMFRAGGWGGQEIMVFPELEMVVVFTGGNWAKKTKLFKIINQYVLPSIL